MTSYLYVFLIQHCFFTNDTTAIEIPFCEFLLCNSYIVLWNGDYYEKLEIIIRPERLDDLKAILYEHDSHGLMITNIMGYGSQRGHKQTYNGIDFDGNLLPKVKK